MKSHLFIILSLLCAASWAGDVQVDTNGNLIVESGAVRAANVLQLPLPTTTIGAAVTLDATAFGKWHLVGGASGNYDITLPPAANNAGKCLGFRVLDASVASNTYTLKPSTVSEKIDGAVDQVLTASGSLAIMSDGSHWARIGGTSTGGGTGGASGTTMVLSDWQSYTPATQGLGTPTAISAAWRRVGDTCEVQVRLTPGTTTAALAYVGLPDNLTIDTKIGSGVAQVVGITGLDQFVNPYAVLAVSGRNYLTFGIWNSSGRTPLSEYAGNIVFTSGTAMSFFARVPIAGWSGTQVVQQGGRFLWSQRYAASATRVTTTPSSPGEYRARRIGIDTAPATLPSVADGFRIDSGSGIAAGRINMYDIYVGPGKVVQLTGYAAPARSTGLSLDHWYGGVHAGAVFSYNQSSGVASVLCYVTANDQVGLTTDAVQVTTGYFDLLVADDPVPVALAPAVHIEAYSTSSQVCTAGTTDVQYENEVRDSQSGWNGTVFAAPVAGVYDVDASAAFTTAQPRSLTAWIGGTEYLQSMESPNNADPMSLHFKRFFAQGEMMVFRVKSNGGTRESSASRNRISITKIGD